MSVRTVLVRNSCSRRPIHLYYSARSNSYDSHSRRRHLKRGALVYDPFLGSGTTLAAAELAERVCLGIEAWASQRPDYFCARDRSFRSPLTGRVSPKNARPFQRVPVTATAIALSEG